MHNPPIKLCHPPTSQHHPRDHVSTSTAAPGRAPGDPTGARWRIVEFFGAQRDWLRGDAPCEWADQVGSLRAHSRVAARLGGPGGKGGKGGVDQTPRHAAGRLASSEPNRARAAGHAGRRAAARGTQASVQPCSASGLR